MDNLILLHIDDCLDYLGEITLDLDVRESFPSFQHIVEAEVGAELQDDVDVFFVFEVLLQENDAGMLHCFVNFNLAH